MTIDDVTSNVSSEVSWSYESDSKEYLACSEDDWIKYVMSDRIHMNNLTKVNRSIICHNEGIVRLWFFFTSIGLNINKSM